MSRRNMHSPTQQSPTEGLIRRAPQPRPSWRRGGEVTWALRSMPELPEGICEHKRRQHLGSATAQSPFAGPPDLKSGLCEIGTCAASARAGFSSTLAPPQATRPRSALGLELSLSYVQAAALRHTCALGEDRLRQDGFETARRRHFLRPPFLDYLQHCIRRRCPVKSQLEGAFALFFARAAQGFEGSPRWH
jgi:hypothetical protein